MSATAPAAPPAPPSITVGHTTFGRGPRAPGFATPWRTLPWLVVQVVESGAYRVEHAGGTIRLPAGTVWCVPAGCRHRHAVDGRAAVVTSHIHLTIQRAGLDACAGLGAPCVFPRALDAPLGQALTAVSNGPPGTTLADALRWQARLATLAAELVAALGDRLPPAVEHPRLAPVFAWAEANLHLPLTRDELAARAGLRPSRFHALLLAATGEAPLAWVRRQRLARAAGLLMASDLDLEDIAARCGFADGHHLSKRFRDAYGMAPTAFRRSAG